MSNDKPQHPRSSQWHAVREKHLKANPTCAACGTSDHLEVHHEKPFHLYPQLELVEHNLITLCESPAHNCHLIFGHLLSWRSWNPLVRGDATNWAQRFRMRPVVADEDVKVAEAVPVQEGTPAPV